MKPRKPIPRKRAQPRRVSVMRSSEYLAFLREEGFCAACFPVCNKHFMAWPVHPWPIPSMFKYECDPAHTTNNGMSSKGGDDTCAPLCREHHREFDSDRKAFERKYGVDMQDVAKAWWDLFNRRK